MNLSKKLKFDEVINLSFSVFFKNFMVYMKNIAAFAIPVIVLGALAMYSMFGGLNDFVSAMSDMSANADIDIEFIQTLFGFYGAMIGYGLLIGLAMLLLSIVYIKVSEDILLERTVSVKENAQFALKRLFPLILTYIVLTVFAIGASIVVSLLFGVLGFILTQLEVIGGILIVIGVLAFYIGILAVVIYLTYITHSVTLDKIYYLSAIRRSVDFVKGNFWAITGLIVIVYFITQFANTIIMIPFFAGPYISFIQTVVSSGTSDPAIVSSAMQGWFSSLWMPTIIVFLFSVFVTSPFYSTALTVKYVNLRNMKEGKGLLDKLENEEVSAE
jgi:hypothetical protein